MPSLIDFHQANPKPEEVHVVILQPQSAVSSWSTSHGGICGYRNPEQPEPNVRDSDFGSHAITCNNALAIFDKDFDFPSRSLSLARPRTIPCPPLFFANHIYMMARNNGCTIADEALHAIAIVLAKAANSLIFLLDSHTTYSTQNKTIRGRPYTQCHKTQATTCIILPRRKCPRLIGPTFIKESNASMTATGLQRKYEIHIQRSYIKRP